MIYGVLLIILQLLILLMPSFFRPNLKQDTTGLLGGQ